MYKILFTITTCLLLLFGCKEENDSGKKPFDRKAVISIYPDRKVSQRSLFDETGTNTYEDSIRAIFKLTPPRDICWQLRSEINNKWCEKGILKENMDTINFRFIWSGRDVIDIPSLVTNEIVLGTMVTDYKDIILVDIRDIDYGRKSEIIGYIPNSVVMEARKKITEAFNRQDYEECYRLFDNAYKFRPITGEAYRELQKQGLN